MKIETFQQAVDYLFSRRAQGMKLGLENIRNLMDRLGHPERRFPSIHVAGTNGKGSTVAILESILREAGYKTGRYISPHLVDMRERIQIRGQSIGQNKVVETIQHMLPHIEATGASFFEILTAMAFLHFSENDVDMAVLETGLGGRLDATTVVMPRLTLITEIGLEHTRILGKRLASIAREKAGILKSGIPCVCGATHWRVKEALSQAAEERNVPLQFTSDHVRISHLHLSEYESRFDCRTQTTNYKSLSLRLLGHHQVKNAALALLAVDELREQGWHIPEEAVRMGLQHVDWRARLDVLQRNPTVVLDSAHNPMGIRTLTRALKTLFQYKRLILVFGVLQDKNYRRMYRQIAPMAEAIILTRPLSDRALEPNALLTLPASQGKRVEVLPDIRDAWLRGMELAHQEDAVCCAGSIYFVGEVLRLWEENRTRYSHA